MSPASGNGRRPQSSAPSSPSMVRSTMGELTESVRDVVDLLALGEPLALDALGSLTEPGAVEDAEQRGLVRIVGEPRLALGASPLRRGAADRDRAGAGPPPARSHRNRPRQGRLTS